MKLNLEGHCPICGLDLFEAWVRMEYPDREPHGNLSWDTELRLHGERFGADLGLEPYARSFEFDDDPKAPRWRRVVGGGFDTEKAPITLRKGFDSWFETLANLREVLESSVNFEMDTSNPNLMRLNARVLYYRTIVHHFGSEGHSQSSNWWLEEVRSLLYRGEHSLVCRLLKLKLDGGIKAIIEDLIRGECSLDALVASEAEEVPE